MKKILLAIFTGIVLALVSLIKWIISDEDPALEDQRMSRGEY